MIDTTLCYIEKDGCYLMLCRNKKINDLNEGKWIGVGGKFEPGETADECIRREALEETGLVLGALHFYGVIHFRSDKWEDEEMYLYGCSEFSGTLTGDCSEGTLAWIPKEKILELKLWEGDRLFLKPMLDGAEKLEMTLRYEGDELVESVIHRG